MNRTKQNKTKKTINKTESMQGEYICPSWKFKGFQGQVSENSRTTFGKFYRSKWFSKLLLIISHLFHESKVLNFQLEYCNRKSIAKIKHLQALVVIFKYFQGLECLFLDWSIFKEFQGLYEPWEGRNTASIGNNSKPSIMMVAIGRMSLLMMMMLIMGVMVMIVTLMFIWLFFRQQNANTHNFHK